MAESEVLTIHGEDVHYCIEPIRFELGLSRVQMIDEHLARLKTDGRVSGPDLDILLDARKVFKKEDDNA